MEMIARWAWALGALLSGGFASGQITGLSFEVDTCFYANLDTTGLFDPANALPGMTTYRLFAEFIHPGDELQAVYALGLGQTLTEPWVLDAPCGCFEHPFGSSLGTGVNAVLLDAFPDLAYDSYYTLDGNPGTSITGGIPLIAGAQDLPQICNTDLADVAMYVLGGVNAGADLRVQIAQITTCGPLDFSACFQVQQVNGTVQNWCTTEPLHIDPPCASWASSTTVPALQANSNPVSIQVPGASAWPVEVELFDAASDMWVGTYLADPNFSAPVGTYYAALKDGNTCRDTTDIFCIPEPFYTCEGDCLDDADGDGICDPLEIPGCLDPESCNYEPLATDLVTCIYAEPGYDCNGDCLADGDGDGVCDPFEIPGCMGIYACNFNPQATDDDGSCTYLPTFSITGPLNVVNAVATAYTYPMAPGNSCTWEASNGDILSGQGTGSVSVEWTAPGLGTLTVEEVADTCTSAPVQLEVNVGVNGVASLANSPLVVISQEEILCIASGSIRLWDLRGRLVLDQRVLAGQRLEWPRSSGAILSFAFHSEHGTSQTGSFAIP